jgi:mono/diheme cytochrome c family protein
MRANLSKSFILAACLIPALAAAQMGRGMGPGMMGGGPSARHFYAMHHGIDPKYAALRNPLSATRENLAAGKALFAQNCAVCHGAAGLGDGPGAKGLDPAPAVLAGLSRMPIASDGFYYWTISEGGIEFKSAMPPFKGTLKEEDIWKLVLYLRTL